MADGLLTSGLNWIDQQKQALKARFGLLADNPEEFARQLAAETQQRMGKGLLGEPKTAEEMASGKWINTPYGKQAIQAFSIAAPITYHGSPHIFNKFDLSKMGTGEGQQMIAPGVYLSESMDFAKKFMQDQRGQAAPTIAKKYLNNWGDNNLAIQKLDERYKTLLNESNPSFAQPYKDAANMLRKGEVDFSGSLYKVDLSDSKARRMLDYEKELKKQPKHIRNIATESGVNLNDTGFDLIQKLGRNQAGVDKLKKAGITGIKYSNEMVPGTSNYVVFDPSIVKILERNEKPIEGLLK